MAESALHALLDDVEDSWSVRHEPLSLAGTRGACLPELNLLPGLAPCALATERAIVLGWDAASLRHALGETPSAQPQTATAARAEIDLSRLHEADRRLAALRPGDGAATHSVAMKIGDQPTMSTVLKK